MKAGRNIEQAACARHLARVCDALSRNQGERIVLSLIPVVPEPAEDGWVLGVQHRRDRAARLQAYRAARDEGLPMLEAGERVDITAGTARAYERWYRSVMGLPRREPKVPWE